MPLSFLKEQFGSRIIAAVLHLDEYTPHLQAIVVPLIIPEEPEEKVRLSARDLFSRENLIALQQAWEDALRPLGVGQRTKRSDLHHVDAKRYGGCIAAIARRPVRGDHDQASCSEDFRKRSRLCRTGQAREGQRKGPAQAEG